MKPRLRLAYIDETAGWSDEIVSVAGCIAALYVYDQQQRTCCCEMTPSYALRLVGYRTEYEVDDTVQMAMMQATDVGGVCYVHCWQVDGFQRLRRRPHHRDIDPFQHGAMPCTMVLPGPCPRDHDTAIEEALEALTQGGYTTT
ncbi:MAG: hypothetical protein ACYDBB_04685 [Armatimonadota bacterium]